MKTKIKIILVTILATIFIVALSLFCNDIFKKVKAADTTVGTIENPILINSKERLYAIHDSINSFGKSAEIPFVYDAATSFTPAETARLSFKMTQEIPVNTDKTNQKFFGIGIEQNPFRGNFDGNNFAISFVRCDDNHKIDNYGIFAFVDGSEKDILIKNALVKGDVISNNNNVGGLIGKVVGGNVTLLNCISRAVINGDNNVGGLIGVIQDGTVTVTVAKNNTSNLNNKISVSSTIKGNDNIGGVVGLVGGDITKSPRLMINTESPTGQYNDRYAVTTFSNIILRNNTTDTTPYNVGLAVGSFDACKETSEIGLVNVYFLYNKSNTCITSSKTGLLGKIGTNLTVNAINGRSCYSTSYAENVEQLPNAITLLGKFNSIYTNSITVYTYTKTIKNLDRKIFTDEIIASFHDNDVKVSPSAPDTKYKTTFTSTVENSKIMRVENNYKDKEFLDVRAYNSGTETLQIKLRLSDFTFLPRNLKLTIELKKPKIAGKDLIIYDVASSKTIDLFNHFDLLENAFDGDIDFSFKVFYSKDGRTETITPTDSTLTVIPGAYNVEVTLSPRKTEAAGSIDADFAPSSDRFTLYVFNEKKQTIEIKPDDKQQQQEESEKRKRAWLITLIIVGSCAVVCVGAVTTILVVRKRKKKNK